MIKFLHVLHDAGVEVLNRWGRGYYLTLDCRAGLHEVCDICYCPCHNPINGDDVSVIAMK